MANEGYHEPIEELSDETRDMHRAIVSLMEELEAVDWYNQRVDACKDDDTIAMRKRSTPRWCSNGFAGATPRSTRSSRTISSPTSPSLTSKKRVKTDRSHGTRPRRNAAGGDP